MSSQDSSDNPVHSSPSRALADIPKFTSFKPQVPSNFESSESHSSGHRNSGSREQRSRGSRRRDDRSRSPRQSSSRHYRTRSRDTTHGRDRHSRRRHETETPLESLDSIRARERRLRNERYPRNKPYPYEDSDFSSPLESFYREDASDKSERSPHESKNEQGNQSDEASASQGHENEQDNQSSEASASRGDMSQASEGRSDSQRLPASDRSRDSKTPATLKTPRVSPPMSVKIAMGLLDSSSQFQHSRFQYSSQPATLSSEINPADIETDDLFVFDKKGDPDSVKYGRSKTTIKYRLGGGGRVLGLGPEYIIDKEQSDDNCLVIRQIVGGPGSREKQENLLNRDRPQIPVYEQHIRTAPRVAPRSRFPSLLFPDPPAKPDFGAPVGGSSSIDLSADFLPFDEDDWGEPPNFPSHEKKPPRWTSMEQILIENGCPLAPPKNTDLGVERRTRNAVLTKAAFDNPTDVSAWLKVINYQDIVVRGSESESLPLTKNELRSLAEMKLSLYSKALRRVRKHEHRDILLLGRLQNGAQLWEREKLLDQWKETLKDNPDCIALWAKYLDFFQTYSPNFSYLECLKVHMEALRTVALQRRTDSRFASLQTYIFLRLTIFHREAGYHELATSLWQALLEYCLFKPEGIDDVHEPDEALAAFQNFWESEVARIGELGANGWNSGANDATAPCRTNYPLQNEALPLMACWTRAERDRMCHLVWRSNDTTNLPFDPSHSICLFSDVREILQLFNGWNSADPINGRDAADSLVNAFLCFNHLPLMTSPRNLQTARAWSWDGFLRTVFAEYRNLGLDLWREKNEEPPKAGEATRNSHPLKYPLPSFLQTTDTLFSSPDIWHWFSSLPWWDNPRYGAVEMIQRTLQCLVQQSLARYDSGDEELIEYHLAFEFNCDPGAAKRAAKNILKVRKDFLRGWNCLAMMEWMAGNKERGNFMWSSMITNSADVPERGILWQSWIWKYVEEGQKAAASDILFSMATGAIAPVDIPQPGQRGTTIGPIVMAQTQSHIRQAQSQALEYNNCLSYVAYTDCLALLYYLGNWPLKAALDVYADAVKKLEESVGEGELNDWKEYTVELLYQARAKLVYHIITQQPKGVWKPIEFRPVFKESLTRFPHNTMIATVWTFIESKILRIDRIRTVEDLIKEAPADQTQLPDITIPTKPISSILLPIWAEISNARGGDRWVVRPMFEKALESSGGARSNLTIWKLYILYELDHVDDVAAAKSVFYRAINACPWSKELAMFGFEQLQRGVSERPSLGPSKDPRALSEEKGLSEEEVERLFLVMCERTLHVRLDIRDEVHESIINRLRARSPERKRSDASPV